MFQERKNLFFFVSISFVCFWTMPSDTQCLDLALCSGITLVGLREPYVVPGIEPGSIVHNQMPTVLLPWAPNLFCIFLNPFCLNVSLGPEMWLHGRSSFVCVRPWVQLPVLPAPLEHCQEQPPSTKQGLATKHSWHQAIKTNNIKHVSLNREQRRYLNNVYWMVSKFLGWFFSFLKKNYSVYSTTYDSYYKFLIL